VTGAHQPCRVGRPRSGRENKAQKAVGPNWWEIKPNSLDSTSGDLTLPASSSASMVDLMSCHSAGPVSFRSSSLLLSNFICKQSQALVIIAIVLRAQVEVRGARTREVERGEL